MKISSASRAYPVGITYGWPSTAKPTWHTRPSSRMEQTWARSYVPRFGMRRTWVRAVGVKVAMSNYRPGSGRREEPLPVQWTSPLMRYAFTLDPASPAPLHRQIYDEWRQGILSGRFRGGERVPS